MASRAAQVGTIGRTQPAHERGVTEDAMPGNIAQFFARHLTRARRTCCIASSRRRRLARRHGRPKSRRSPRRWQAAFRREGFAAGDRIAICAPQRRQLGRDRPGRAGHGAGRRAALRRRQRRERRVVRGHGGGAAADRREFAARGGARANAPARGRRCRRVVVLRPDDGEPAATAATFLPDSRRRISPWPNVAADTLATICFTSGTTGRPKGVMLSHRNIVSDLRAVLEAVSEICGRPQRFLSFLPLSHMFERTAGYYVPMCMDADAQVVYARGFEPLGEDMISQKPSIIVSVPRIFERVSRAHRCSRWRKSPAEARGCSTRASRGGCPRRARGQGPRSISLLVPGCCDGWSARPVLGAAWAAGCAWRSSAARRSTPSSRATFIGLGLPMLQGYGMTEASPVISRQPATTTTYPDSVGPPLPRHRGAARRQTASCWCAGPT